MFEFNNIHLLEKLFTNKKINSIKTLIIFFLIAVYACNSSKKIKVLDNNTSVKILVNGKNDSAFISSSFFYGKRKLENKEESLIFKKTFESTDSIYFDYSLTVFKKGKISKSNQKFIGKKFPLNKLASTDGKIFGKTKTIKFKSGYKNYYRDVIVYTPPAYKR